MNRVVVYTEAMLITSLLTGLAIATSLIIDEIFTPHDENKFKKLSEIGRLMRLTSS
ncbi:hypothetical protein [Alteromonas sp. ASW11-130]|uniref:hypothetical protein n=1 Tax=Alteromonas sp. ASW11-130 TaxID=3015775 RepID=UPI002242794D|nr:hypothetical protein [Alteromonas sp. ASW11-130]MCW8092341.1 hypothetical protein [Alteromonas sp. ASW11-130]